ncbi:MAG: DUF6891 domain-containing protein [Nocardioidaceae bacterium]
MSPLFRSGPKVGPRQRVDDFARVLVRAGLIDDAGVLAEVADLAATELGGDGSTVAAEAVRAARRDWRADEAGWPAVTDHDRLDEVFDELPSIGVVVLQAVDDHWAATTELTRRDDAGEPPEGIVWFTPADVWHAVDHGMLEVNLWHGDSANAAPGDVLLDDVLATFARHGLRAHFDEGRIEVAAHWQRRSPTRAPDVPPA